MNDRHPDPVPATPRAVLLLSGGLDSTTMLALARSEGFDVYDVETEFSPFGSDEDD